MYNPHMANPTDQELTDILRECRRVAVVGLSPKPDRDSNKVADYLIRNGYEVVGVRPGGGEVLGRPGYSTLDEVPGPLEIVDVFRSPDAVPALVDELLPMRPRVLWLQLGVTHAEAEARARAAGIVVVSNRCIKLEHERLLA
jgi:predicted CoA-binding protein